MTYDLELLEETINLVSSAPSLDQMPKLTLEDKGIAGPTSAHFLETIHTPHNFSYVAFTTGSSAFQNIVGVTKEELPARSKATKNIFSLLNVSAGAKVLFTYAPLVNVFSKMALDECGCEWCFLPHSSRDDLMLALLKDKPDVVIGESSFIRHTIEAIAKINMLDSLSYGLQIIAVGTPLDLDLLEYVKYLDVGVHDLYGCQEFGWLFLDGIPVRDDISLIESTSGKDLVEVIVGGLPMGDSFPYVSSEEKGHLCNHQGRLLTYKRQRSYPEYDVLILSSSEKNLDLLERTSRSILRIKGRVVRVSSEIKLGADKTIFGYVLPGTNKVICEIDVEEKLELFDSLLKAQYTYQTESKSDPTWIKNR